MYEQVNIINKLLKEKNIQKAIDIKYALTDIYKVLGLLQQDPLVVTKEIKDKYLRLYNINENEIISKIVERRDYKKSKNWNEADKIRDDLSAKGILIKDKGENTEWDVEIPPKKKIKIN